MTGKQVSAAFEAYLKSRDATRNTPMIHTRRIIHSEKRGGPEGTMGKVAGTTRKEVGFR